MEETPSEPVEQAPKRRSIPYGTIGIVIGAPLLALVITLYGIQSYQVDGASMETSLHNADKLIVNKLPRTISRVTGNAYLPARGDVIIFFEPASGLDGVTGKQLIKRVVGLPGDRVVVKNGTLTVYNAEHPDGYNPDTTNSRGRNTTITRGAVDVTVPANHLFVCGDNRGNSRDSRDFGPIAASQVIGKASLKLFPINEAGML